MRVPAGASLLSLVIAVSTACGPRQVEVRTAPTTPATASPSVQLTNNLSQAVNVYVVSTGGGELFLRQVPANTSETVPVTGLATGSPVTFKAVTVDGSRTYQSRTAPLSGAAFLWSVP
ncbi:MAG TPA: hypothetical protein VGP25_14035 [Gemmatimonadaceae bacterium]|jgi:hypothetical protein|nr:hypothetical protein [Gemmatimonadaceae bacterium]